MAKRHDGELDLIKPAMPSCICWPGVSVWSFSRSRFRLSSFTVIGLCTRSTQEVFALWFMLRPRRHAQQGHIPPGTRNGNAEGESVTSMQSYVFELCVIADASNLDARCVSTVIW